MADNTQRLVRELFDAASELPAPDRQAWVEARAKGNREVVACVMRLLQAASASGGSFLAEPAFKREKPALQEGMMIGPYRVLRELGSGGMGVVYLTMRSDEVYRRLAALKVIRPELRANPVKDRFLQERQILARLDHPNIARIIDGGTTPNGLPYFVMDYIDGQPLDVFCKEKRASIQQRLNLFRQTCEAVQYLHDNDVLHRDLKPANILVTHAGQVKLLDFGVSKMGGEFSSTETTGLPILTAGYASPEQITSKPVTAASDIYSLGVVLYELLTGVRPLKFDGLGLPEILTAVTTKVPSKPSQVPLSREADPERVLSSIRPQLVGDLDGILMMALRKEPERRYVSAQEFSEDIERYQTGRPVIARGDGRAYIVARSLRRHRVGIAAGLAIALSLTLGAWGWSKHVRDLDTILTLSRQVEAAREQLEKEKVATDPEASKRLAQDLNRLTADYESRTPAVLQSRFVARSATRNLVQESLSYFAEAGQSTGNDPDAVAALGRAYLAVAETQWSPDRPSLNDPVDAKQTCVTALNLLKASASLAKSAEIQQVAQHITAVLEQNPETLQLGGQGSSQ
jgi:serine/threonine protein kinase